MMQKMNTYPFFLRNQLPAFVRDSLAFFYRIFSSKPHAHLIVLVEDSALNLPKIEAEIKRLRNKGYSVMVHTNTIKRGIDMEALALLQDKWKQEVRSEQ